MREWDDSPRHWYAISWNKGQGVRQVPENPTSDRDADFHVFDTRLGRARWVLAGAKTPGEPDYREALPSSDRELQNLLRDEDGWEVMYFHYWEEEKNEPAS